MIEFLTAMHFAVRHPILLVWDGVPVHKAAADWFRTNHPAWFQFEPLPPYSPELNPVEECWQYSKCTDLANYAAQDLDDLETHVSASLTKHADDQELLKAHFQYAGLPLN
jgi:transposase